MSLSSKFESDELIGHLRIIYGDSAGAILGDIENLVTKYSAAVATCPQRGNLSQRDVLLITYGDTLHDGDAPPLSVLHRFLRTHLLGIFQLIHILPFHPYSSDDGFSVIDYSKVRDDLGDWDDIARLATECRVMADAVVNHMSSRSDWFREFLNGNPDYDDFFVECDPSTDLSSVVRPRTSPLLTEFEDASGRKRHIWTTFSADQVDLNFRNAKVLIAIIDALFNLIAKGASLLRLDAVTFLWKQPGTSSANMRETHLLIKILRAAIALLDRNVIVVTETNVPHDENVAYFGNGRDEAHMVYNFALPPLIAHSFVNGDSRRLTEWAGQLSVPSNEVCFLNFTASHDGVGVRPVEDILDAAELQGLVDATQAAGGSVSYRTIGDGRQRPYELNCTFLDLISSAGDSTVHAAQRFVASQAIVLSMPGVPAVYIHSLLGTRNDLQRVAETGMARSINRSQLEIDNVESTLADPDSLTGRIYNGLIKLIRLRQEEPAFDPYAEFAVLDLGGDVFCIRRWAVGATDSVICVVNLMSTTSTITLDASMAGEDMLSGQDFQAGPVQLPVFAVRWIRCRCVK